MENMDNGRYYRKLDFNVLFFLFSIRNWYLDQIKYNYNSVLKLKFLIYFSSINPVNLHDID